MDVDNGRHARRGTKARAILFWVDSNSQATVVASTGPRTQCQIGENRLVKARVCDWAVDGPMTGFALLAIVELLDKQPGVSQDPAPEPGMLADPGLHLSAASSSIWIPSDVLGNLASAPLCHSPAAITSGSASC